MMNGWFKRNRPINLATSFHSKYIHVFIHTLLNDTYSPRLQRGVTQIKEELVSIQTCKKENGKSSGQWVTSICHSSLGCKPRELIPCAMGWRCRDLQVEQLLIISLAWQYGIFHSWCREPALLCNRACFSSGVSWVMGLGRQECAWICVI